MSPCQNTLLPPLVLARAFVLQRAPYFASALYGFRETSCPGLGTLAVDAEQRLFVDYEAVNKVMERKDGVARIAASLVHEVLHILNYHLERAEQVGVETPEESALWNVAADLALWAPMHASGWSTKGQIGPRKFGIAPGKTVEDYYWRLRERRGEEVVSGAVAKVPPQTCQPPHVLTPQVQRQRRMLRLVLAQAIEAHQRVHGAVPDSLWWAVRGELKEPQVPWARLLAGATRGGLIASGADDYSRSRPSRHQQATPDVLRPALVARVARIAVVVDTSGSMSDPDLAGVLSEVRGILRTIGAEVMIIPTDAAAHGCQQIWRTAEIKLVGGGGTDMGAGLKAAAKLRPACDLAVVLTDGISSWPEQKPILCPIVVVLLGADHASALTVPSWARVIEVDGFDNGGVQ